MKCSLAIEVSSLFVDLEGTSVTPEEEEVLRHPFVTGVILFSRNFESRVQLEMLIKKIRMVREPSLGERRSGGWKSSEVSRWLH